MVTCAFFPCNPLDFEEGLGCYLHLNIENTYSALLCDILHRLNTGAVVVSSKLRMLDESVLAHEIQKVFLGRVVIFASMLLTWSRSPGGIYIDWLMLFRKMYDQLEKWERGCGRGEHTRNRKPKGIREFSKKSLQKSRLSSSRWSRYYHRTKLLHCIWSIRLLSPCFFAITNRSGKKPYRHWLPLSTLGSKKTEIVVY